MTRRGHFAAALCFILPILMATASVRGAAQDRSHRTIRLNFANTDVSDVLQAIGRFYRANIVYPAQAKLAISLNVSASTVEEALRFATGSAGLAYRRIRDTYVVATPANMRSAMEPFGEKDRIRLNTLTPAQAVTIIEGALPFMTARPAGNQVLLIGSPDDIAQAKALIAEQDLQILSEPQANQVFTLQYAPALQVAPMLKSMFPKLTVDPIGAADKPGGTIGLSGPRSQVDAARAVLREVDVPTAPKEPEKLYRIYNIKYSSAPALKEFLEKALPQVAVHIAPEQYSPLVPGFRPLTPATIGTSNLGSAGGGAGGATSGTASGSSSAGTATQVQTKVKDGDRSKMLVLIGTAEQMNAAFDFLKDVDVAPKQVVVDVRVVDISPEQAQQLGMKWSWTRFGMYEAPAGTHVSASGGQIGGDFVDFLTRPLGFGQFSRVPWSFQSILSAMITRKEAKLLADPKIEVIDNEDASIFIGDTLNIQVNSVGALGASASTIASFPVGIILLVRPRMNADNNITLRVHPVVSTVTNVNSDGLPQTSNREADTTVLLKDGETVVIGGLIRDEMSKTVTEVPLLSKLPLVGELFRHRDTSHNRKEIMIFMTPHIVKTGA